MATCAVLPKFDAVDMRSAALTTQFRLLLTAPLVSQGLRWQRARVLSRLGCADNGKLLRCFMPVLSPSFRGAQGAATLWTAFDTVFMETQKLWWSLGGYYIAQSGESSRSATSMDVLSNPRGWRTVVLHHLIYHYHPTPLPGFLLVRV